MLLPNKMIPVLLYNFIPFLNTQVYTNCSDPQPLSLCHSQIMLEFEGVIDSSIKAVRNRGKQIDCWGIS